MKRFYHVRIIFMMMTLVHSAIASTEALETARSTVKEWAATEKVISLEVTEWNGRKHLLDDLIEVAAHSPTRGRSGSGRGPLVGGR